MFTRDILLSVLLRSAPACFPSLKLSRLDLGPELEIWQTSNPDGSQRNIIQSSLFIIVVCAYCKFFLDSRDIWSCYVSRSKHYVEEFDPTGKNKPGQQDGDALSWPRFIVLLHLFRLILRWGFTEQTFYCTEDMKLVPRPWTSWEKVRRPLSSAIAVFGQNWWRRPSFDWSCVLGRERNICRTFQRSSIIRGTTCVSEPLCD